MEIRYNVSFYAVNENIDFNAVLNNVLNTLTLANIKFTSDIESYTLTLVGTTTVVYKQILALDAIQKQMYTENNIGMTINNTKIISDNPIHGAIKITNTSMINTDALELQLKSLQTKKKSLDIKILVEQPNKNELRFYCSGLKSFIYIKDYLNTLYDDNLIVKLAE